MGVYIEQAGFSIAASKQHLLSLIIEPSLRGQAVCFQIHKMNDDSIAAFWNFSPDSKALVLLAQHIVTEDKSLSNASFSVLLDSPAFQKEMRSSYPPFKKELSSTEIDIVNCVLNAQLPQDISKPHGLDGHSYTLFIYTGDDIRRYYCWCVIPKEWQVLKPLISLLLGIANLDRATYGCM